MAEPPPSIPVASIGVPSIAVPSIVLPSIVLPSIVLVEPQLGDNIGAAARAMLNCGLSDLRLVRPRDGWPSEAARANAAGADLVIDRVRVYERLEDAIGDLRLVFATTARTRDMVKPLIGPAPAATRLVAAAKDGLSTGVLFGRERSGLSNDEVALADAAVTFPLNPDFRSLNLAQAVLLVAWEFRRAFAPEAPPIQINPDASPPAKRAELVQLFEHLEGELDAAGFFFPPEKRVTMVRNLRNLLGRAALSEQDVRTLRGVIRSLSKPRLQPDR